MKNAYWRLLGIPAVVSLYQQIADGKGKTLPDAAKPPLVPRGYTLPQKASHPQTMSAVRADRKKRGHTARRAAARRQAARR